MTDRQRPASSGPPSGLSTLQAQVKLTLAGDHALPRGGLQELQTGIILHRYRMLAWPGRVLAAVSQLAGNRSAVDHRRSSGLTRTGRDGRRSAPRSPR